MPWPFGNFPSRSLQQLARDVFGMSFGLQQTGMAVLYSVKGPVGNECFYLDSDTIVVTKPCNSANPSNFHWRAG